MGVGTRGRPGDDGCAAAGDGRLVVDEFRFGARLLGTLAAEMIQPVLGALGPVDARRWIDGSARVMPLTIGGHVPRHPGVAETQQTAIQFQSPDAAAQTAVGRPDALNESPGVTGRFHPAQIDLSAQLQVFVGRRRRQESGIADVTAAARAGFAVNLQFHRSGGQPQLHLMPEPVVDGLIAEEIDGASAAGVQADSQMSLDEFDGRKVRLGRRSAAVEQNAVAALRLELESQGGPGFGDARPAERDVRVGRQEAHVLLGRGVKLGAAIPADGEGGRRISVRLLLLLLLPIM